MSRVNTSSQLKLESASQQAGRITQLVRRIYKTMDRIRHEREQEGGLTRPQANVIELLLEHPNLSLKDIAQALELSHGTVSGIVARLETAKLLERTPDSNDRRIMRHNVTDAVRDYAQHEARKPVNSPISTLLEQASNQDRHLILEALTRLEQLIEIG